MNCGAPMHHHKAVSKRLPRLELDLCQVPVIIVVHRRAAGDGRRDGHRLDGDRGSGVALREHQ